jgi:hypothetical protein
MKKLFCLVLIALAGCGQSITEISGACVMESMKIPDPSKDNRIDFVHSCMNSKGFDFTFNPGCVEQRLNALASDACYQKSGWLAETMRKIAN